MLNRTWHPNPIRFRCLIPDVWGVGASHTAFSDLQKLRKACVVIHRSAKLGRKLYDPYIVVIPWITMQNSHSFNPILTILAIGKTHNTLLVLLMFSWLPRGSSTQASHPGSCAACVRNPKP